MLFKLIGVMVMFGALLAAAGFSLGVWLITGAVALYISWIFLSLSD